jgi:HSP20 family protein
MARLSRRGEQRGTEVARWAPFRELEDVYERMGRLMHDVFGESAAAGTWPTPPIDLEETDDAFVAEMDLPGVAREDVTVELAGNEIHVSGELKEKERTGVVRRQTRRLGRFDYRFTLPAEVDPDKVEASLADGVLTVRAGKAAGTKPQRIEVKPV